MPDLDTFLWNNKRETAREFMQERKNSPESMGTLLAVSAIHSIDPLVKNPNNEFQSRIEAAYAYALDNLESENQDPLAIYFTGGKLEPHTETSLSTAAIGYFNQLIHNDADRSDLFRKSIDTGRLVLLGDEVNEFASGDGVYTTYDETVAGAKLFKGELFPRLRNERTEYQGHKLQKFFIAARTKEFIVISSPEQKRRLELMYIDNGILPSEFIEVQIEHSRHSGLGPRIADTMTAFAPWLWKPEQPLGIISRAKRMEKEPYQEWLRQRKKNALVKLAGRVLAKIK